MNTKEKDKTKGSIFKLLFVVLFTAVLCWLALLFYSNYSDMHHSRALLTKAKVVRLAAITVSQECYANGNQFADFSSENGFAPGISSKILTLSEAEGGLKLLQTDSQEISVISFCHTQGEFTVVYNSANSTNEWNVYKNNVLIK